MASLNPLFYPTISLKPKHTQFSSHVNQHIKTTHFYLWLLETAVCTCDLLHVCRLAGCTARRECQHWMFLLKAWVTSHANAFSNKNTRQVWWSRWAKHCAYSKENMVMIRQQKHFLELIETRVLIGGLVHVHILTICLTANSKGHNTSCIGTEYWHLT